MKKTEAGEPSVAAELDAIDPETRQLIADIAREAVEQDRREQDALRRQKRRALGRRAGTLLTCAVLVGAGLWTGRAYATNHCQNDAGNGIVCFLAGEPAVAADMNQNFVTVKSWIEDKIGPVGQSGSISTTSATVDTINAATADVTNASITNADLGTAVIDTVSVPTDVAGNSGGLLINQGSTNLRIDGNEIETDGSFLLNATNKNKVDVGGRLDVGDDLHVSGGLYLSNEAIEPASAVFPIPVADPLFDVGWKACSAGKVMTAVRFTYANGIVTPELKCAGK